MMEPGSLPAAAANGTRAFPVPRLRTIPADGAPFAGQPLGGM
jgi:hypothetical protein